MTTKAAFYEPGPVGDHCEESTGEFAHGEMWILFFFAKFQLINSFDPCFHLLKFFSVKNLPPRGWEERGGGKELGLEEGGSNDPVIVYTYE
jgi:hypothetical protein